VSGSTLAAGLVVSGLSGSRGLSGWAILHAARHLSETGLLKSPASYKGVSCHKPLLVSGTTCCPHHRKLCVELAVLTQTSPKLRPGELANWRVTGWTGWPTDWTESKPEPLSISRLSNSPNSPSPLPQPTSFTEEVLSVLDSERAVGLHLQPVPVDINLVIFKAHERYCCYCYCYCYMVQDLAWTPL